MHMQRMHYNLCICMHMPCTHMYAYAKYAMYACMYAMYACMQCMHVTMYAMYALYAYAMYKQTLKRVSTTHLERQEAGKARQCIGAKIGQ